MIRSLLDREMKIVVANAELVTGGDRLALQPSSVELNSVGRAHVHHEVLSIEALHHGVLTGYIRILDRQVARLLSTADDEAILVHFVLLSAIVQEEAVSRR